MHPRALGRALLLLTLASGVVATAPRAGAAGATVTVPGSIDSTGSRDVTGELNTFLAGVPAGATVQFAAGGRYRIDGTVMVPRPRDVVLDGQGATLVAPTDGSGAATAAGRPGRRRLRSRAHLVILGGNGVTVRELTIQGPNASGEYRPALEAQAGIVLRRSHGVTLDHVTVRATFGDAVYVTGRSSMIEIRNATFDHNGRQGVAVVAGQEVTVEQSEIRNPGRSAIDLEPARGPASGIRILDNRIVDAPNTFVAALGAGGGVGDVHVERNHVSGGRGLTIVAGVRRTLRSGFHVVDNTADGTSSGLDGTLMTFVSWDGVEVRGNRQAVASGVVPVAFTNSCHTTVSGNNFGSAAAAVRTTGDCSSVGSLPARSSPTTRPGARRGGGIARRGSAGTTPPSTVVITNTVHERSPLEVVLAFLAGIAAGAGGLYLARWNRRGPRPAGPAGDGRGADPSAQSSAPPVGDA